MIHSTFPTQTISQYVRNLDRKLCNTLDQNKINAIYEKSKITTKEKLNKTNRPCTKLREHILKECKDVFKDYLGPGDRVNIEPVHLKIDESRCISPVQATKAFDIPHHLMKPATTEINEMLRSGVLTKNDDSTPWCSQAFPVQKPGSDPIKCRWVSDFCNLNKAL